MRKLSVGLITFTAVLALAFPAFAKVETLRGKVVDEGCSMAAMSHGPDHKPAMDMTACAIACAKNGEPLALLTSDGRVYRITGGLAANKNEKLIAHVGKAAEITGDVTEKDGKKLVASDSIKSIAE